MVIIAGGIYTSVSTNLNAQQIATAAQFAMKLSLMGGPLVYSKLATKLPTVLTNNLGPVMGQINKVVKIYKNKGIQANPIYQRIYAKLNEFLTFKRVETVISRLKAQFTAQEWNAIYQSCVTYKVFQLQKYPSVFP
uniref:Uncharacterized protein n=1 Tax=Panagrolaimus sp. JU765 TaxID=591449 RepID=A0AC34RQY3_9BILA